MACKNFFHSIFPCANIFFVLRLPPHKFSNGLSLTFPLGKVQRLRQSERIFAVAQINLTDFRRTEKLDCEQPLFFFSFSKGSARTRERLAAKPRDARNEGGAFSRAWSFACLARFARLTKKTERLLVVY